MSTVVESRSSLDALSLSGRGRTATQQHRPRGSPRGAKAPTSTCNLDMQTQNPRSSQEKTRTSSDRGPRRRLLEEPSRVGAARDSSRPVRDSRATERALRAPSGRSKFGSSSHSGKDLASRSYQDPAQAIPFAPSPRHKAYVKPACAPELQHFGSWCEYPPAPHSSVLAELEDYPGEVSSKGRFPRTPRDVRLATPDLSPMCTDFAFCACPEDEDERIGEQWCLAPKQKTDAQLAWAMAYIEDRKTGGGAGYRPSL